jgi:hypothetical protein
VGKEREMNQNMRNREDPILCRHDTTHVFGYFLSWACLCSPLVQAILLEQRAAQITDFKTVLSLHFGEKGISQVHTLA